MIPQLTETLEFQSNGRRPQYAEVGTTGIDTWGGYIYEAYHADLYWPGVYEMYNRLRRSDPEIAIIRQLYSAMAHDVRFEWQLPDDATPADEALNEWLNTLLDDIEGGQRQFIGTLVSHVPFMGWGWWEAVPGLRDPAWRPPAGDEWESQYADGLIGFRRMAFRDHSSFEKWDIDDSTGRLAGMVQRDHPNPPVMIPLDKSIHLTFGDSDNPEGLSPLEAVWRLERVKYGLEVVQGIGYEHAAGHVKFTSFEELDAVAKATIRQAARAMLSAQEGNYITEIDGKFTADVIDVNFQAAPAILEAIRYYGLLKLQVYNMQWIAIASTAGGGAYSAMQDSSTMMLTMYNAMMSGFAEQVGEQLWRQARRYNPALFAGTSAKQRLDATPIEKDVNLEGLALILPVIQQMIDLGEEDILTIRRLLNRVNIISDAIPQDAEPVVTEPENVEANPDAEPIDEDAADEEAEPEDELQMAELQGQEFPGDSQEVVTVTDADRQRAESRFVRWARDNAPWLINIFDRDVPTDDGS